MDVESRRQCGKFVDGTELHSRGTQVREFKRYRRIMRVSFLPALRKHFTERACYLLIVRSYFVNTAATTATAINSSLKLLTSSPCGQTVPYDVYPGITVSLLHV